MHRAMHLLPFAGMQVGEFSRLNRQLISARKSSSLQGADPNASDDTCLLQLVVLEGLVREISTFEGPRSEGVQTHMQSAYHGNKEGGQAIIYTA